MNIVDEAKKAMKNAYAPYSKFKVGAAILLKDGKVVYGANIENSSFGLCNCAERSALFSLYSNGYKKSDIVEMAIVADTKNAVSPCGACRQVIAELVPKKTKITLSNLTGDTKVTNISELLPYSFDFGNDPK